MQAKFSNLNHIPKDNLIRAECLHKDKTVTDPKAKKKEVFSGTVPAFKVTVTQ